MKYDIYDIDGQEEIDLEIAKQVRQLDKIMEDACVDQLRRQKGRPQKKVDVIKEYNEERKMMIMEGRMKDERLKAYYKIRGNDRSLNLSWKDALLQAEATFKKSKVMHYSFLRTLNDSMAHDLYEYLKNNYYCRETRNGTLKLIG